MRLILWEKSGIPGKKRDELALGIEFLDDQTPDVARKTIQEFIGLIENASVNV